jgi:hypothetical protein
LADQFAKHQGGKVTAQLNAVYSAEESRLDRSLLRTQARSLPRESWLIERSEVWADLCEPEGSEVGYRLPVVIVQSDAFNRSRLHTVIAVVLTL